MFAQVTRDFKYTPTRLGLRVKIGSICLIPGAPRVRIAPRDDAEIDFNGSSFAMGTVTLPLTLRLITRCSQPIPLRISIQIKYLH